MIFQVDPGQLKSAVACLDRFTAELRRLNDNLEAGRSGSEPAVAAREPAARPAVGRPAE